MWWLDSSTSPATLRIRNNTNSAWVSCGNLNEMSYLAGVTSGIQAQLNGKQNALGYTPVQQGTGIGQLNNVVKIGWSGSRLKCTVDYTDLGEIATTAFVAAADNILQSQINGKQNALGYTPVQQGTGIGQLTNVIKIGWSGSVLKCTVDANDIGAVWTDQSSPSSFASNGYQKLPSGLIIQWGTQSTSTSTVTFPISFPNVCLHANWVYENTGFGNQPRVTGRTKTGFNLAVDCCCSCAGAQPAAWFAIGY
jgi:hypothetical protein